MSLNEEQRKKIGEYIKLFKKYSESEEYKKDLEERKAREMFLSEALRKDRIESMTEFDFGEIVSKLWAAGMWANKEYLVQKIINDNGLDKIKDRLKDLLKCQRAGSCIYNGNPMFL